MPPCRNGAPQGFRQRQNDDKTSQSATNCFRSNKWYFSLEHRNGLQIVKNRPRSRVADLLRETSLARPLWFMRDISETAVSIITSPVLRRRRYGAAILNWHGVTRQFVDPAVEVSHISSDLFRKQIRHIQKHYHIVSLAKLVTQLEAGESIPENWVVLTFDDGFRNNFVRTQELAGSHTSRRLYG